MADIGSGAGFPAVFLAFLLQSNFHLFEPNP
ncbi:16S rRNA (guanine(527)-N(7))-methyltransferase RsmG, partial [Campylobacter jejuni]